MSAIDPKKEIIKITNESTIHAFGTDLMIDVEKDIWYVKCMNPNAKKDIMAILHCLPIPVSIEQA